MNTLTIKDIAKKIEAILEIESDINISEIIKKINIRDEMVLIAIGFLLRDGKIYLDEKHLRITMGFNQFSF